jgi:hypothetical protein
MTRVGLSGLYQDSSRRVCNIAKLDSIRAQIFISNFTKYIQECPCIGISELGLYQFIEAVWNIVRIASFHMPQLAPNKTTLNRIVVTFSYDPCNLLKVFCLKPSMGLGFRVYRWWVWSLYVVGVMDVSL